MVQMKPLHKNKLMLRVELHHMQKDLENHIKLQMEIKQVVLMLVIISFFFIK